MKKNKRLLILVGILLVFGGFTFAYFVGRMLTEGSGATTTVTTAELKNSKVTVTGTLNFDYDGMLPGHKDVSGIIVTAIGNNELIPYNLVWKGTNNLNTDLKFTVYKVSDNVDVDASCNQIKKNVSGGIMMYEECEISNITSLGESISEGTIKGNSSEITVTLASNEFITSTSKGTSWYYYVVLEYPNLNESQNLDMGYGFEGEVTVEPSNIEPDVNILAINVYNEETGKYEESQTIPEGNYTLSKESQCSNGAVPSWDNNKNGLLVTSLTQSGTECYLYFDEYNPSKQTLANLGISGDSQGKVDKFTGTSCGGSCKVSENGLYEAEDDFGTSYYYRGTVSNNWVVFGKDKSGANYLWWRIIRINGNGTIRLIYAGTSSSNKTAPSTQGADTMITPRTPANNSYPKSVYFNEKYNDNKYVGYMYNNDPTVSTSHEQAHKVTSSSTKSTVLDEIENWYTNNTNLSSLATNYIDVDTGFCSDTTISTTNHGSSYPGTGQGFGTQQTAYAGADRVWQSNSTSWNSTEQTPTLKCGKDDASRKRDLYTGPGANANGTKGSNGTTITGNGALPVPVGLITMDEVIYAGGFAGQANNGYWLYTNQYYWTMSPSRMYSGSSARVFYVTDSGYLDDTLVYNHVLGVRPVINLKADTKFTVDGEGDSGTRTNPYIVVTD